MKTYIDFVLLVVGHLFYIHHRIPICETLSFSSGVEETPLFRAPRALSSWLASQVVGGIVEESLV